MVLAALDDGDLVGYYLGSSLTREELRELTNNPTTGRLLAFIIDFQGLIVDGWDHHRKCCMSMMSLINNFCDHSQYNYEPSVE